MSRWLVELVGERGDLEDLTYWFRSGPVAAYEWQDATVLADEGLDEIEDIQQVFERASETLDRLSGVVTLFEPGHCRPRLGAVYELLPDGSRRKHALASVKFVMRLKTRIDCDVVGAETNTPRQTQAEVLLPVVSTHSHLETAVVLIGDGVANWARLYRVLEESNGTSVRRWTRLASPRPGSVEGSPNRRT